MNVANLLARAGRSSADRSALAVGSQHYATYGELAGRVAALAGAFGRRFGLSPGDRVALLMRNCPAYVEVLFACWHGGFVAVPINAKLAPPEIAYILAHSGARLCFATPELAQTAASLQAELDDLAAVFSVDDADYFSLAAGDTIAVVPRMPDDTAWLFYTSGTTGRPKGVMLSHRSLLAMTLSYFADVDSIAADDCILHPAPMSHGSGLYILPHVAAAALQVIPPSGGFEPGEIFDLIAAHRGVSMFAAPTMVHRLVSFAEARHVSRRGATDNLKTIVYGGGPMYVEDCKQALAVFGNRLVQIYGQGESPMTITALSKARHAETDHPRYDARLASVGVAHSVVEVAVADADDRMLPPGETGEVLVRGDPVMTGYWRDPEASAETLRGGWLHTGDVGVFDEDGFLTLKDRSKDLIISGGANIYPREVEEVLLRHPAVAEVSVVGQPDREWGESIVAFIVTKSGAAIESAALDAVCNRDLARFKRPRRYVFTDALPKNNYGKILKTELRRRLVEQQQRATEDTSS
ncbi:MAG: AMP-binding protein [Rhodospirillales bacterium]|nr:AMP-binding protein [Rhodospirillales bacterium]